MRDACAVTGAADSTLTSSAATATIGVEGTGGGKTGAVAVLSSYYESLFSFIILLFLSLY